MFSLNKKSFYSLAFCLLALFCSLGLWRELQVQPDSESYLTFADEILNLDIFRHGDSSWSTVIITPAYPVLLASVKAGFGDSSTAVLSMHFLSAFIALSFFVLRFSPLISSQAAIFLGFIGLFMWREYYNVLLTEWVALCALLVFFCSLPLKLEELTGRRFLLISLLISFLILLRPAFFCLLPVLVGLVLFMVPKENLRQAFSVILVGLVPVFLWAVFNLYRLNSFTVAASLGHNLFGNATLVGNTAFDEDPSSRLSRFADYINQKKVPAAGTEEETLPQLLANYQALTKTQNYNVYQVALNFEPGALISRVEYDQLMKDYAIAVIIENPREYLNLFFSGLAVAKRDLWLMFVSIICLMMMIKNGHQMSVVLATALAVHLSHLILVSFIQITIESCYMLTLIPLGMFTVAALLSAAGVGKMAGESGL